MWSKLPKPARIVLPIVAVVAAFLLGTTMAGTETVYRSADVQAEYEAMSTQAPCDTFIQLTNLVDMAVAENTARYDTDISIGLLSLAWQAKGTSMQDAAYELARRNIVLDPDLPPQPQADVVAQICGLSPSHPDPGTNR